MKKLLSILSVVGISATSASSVVACSATVNQGFSREISNTLIHGFKKLDLGELNNLAPLTDDNDANIYNTDNSGTNVHSVHGYGDYSPADKVIGTYEVAKELFKVNKIAFQYPLLYGFTFVLTKDSSKTNGYKMTVRSANGQEVVCTFTSNKDIHLSVNSVVDDTKEIHVADGNIKTISKAFENISTDPSVKLGVWNRENPDGINSINIDSQTGRGTIQLYDTTGKYTGFVNAQVIIDNYEPLSFDWFGNPYSFYNDRTAAQNKSIDEIDKNYKTTTLNKDKHVIVFGFDGIRYDKYLKYEKPYLNSGFTDYAGPDNQPYYSQPSESVFGWKQDLTGSIDGNKTNIFDMVNNAKNTDDMDAIGNFMWDSFETKVFAQHNRSGSDNISTSFDKDDSYVNSGIDKYEDVWINKAKEIIKNNPDFKDVTIPSYHGTIDNQAYDNGIWNATENEKKFSLLKSKVTYAVTQDMMKAYSDKAGRDPNLVFNYDTEEDDEGHAFDGSGMKSFNAFYDSDMAHDTFKEYANQMNDALAKYGNNPNYLILQIVDHGRNSVDSGHSPWDPDARKGWMVSNNNNLAQYLGNGQTKDDINQYSIKEIIWNFLKN